MKTKSAIYPVIFAVLLLSILFCCKKEAIQVVPSITTSSVSDITATSVSCGGSITSDGGAAVTARGVCWSTSHNPTIADNKTNDNSGTGSFTSSLIGLLANTNYYLRAYATNEIGTTYGNEKIVVLYLNAPSTNVTDIEGNVYHTVIIGTQVWMVENLKTTKFNNGDLISNKIFSDDEWYALTTPAYCWYNNDSVTNKATYGALYNGYTVVDRRNIAPKGWHVPTSAEWTTLTTFLGGGNEALNKLKESGTSHWPSQEAIDKLNQSLNEKMLDPNTGATNISGFTALPGGFRGLKYLGLVEVGWFFNLGFTGCWWSRDWYTIGAVPPGSFNYGTMIYWYDTSLGLSSTTKFQFGWSVRCVRD